MLEFLKETFFSKLSHTIFFGVLIVLFVASHLSGFSYFNDIKTEDTKTKYNRNSSIYHK